jgi:spermidine synthase
MARKSGELDSFRERGAASKTFVTRYYSVDIHKAALSLPPFVAEALRD